MGGEKKGVKRFKKGLEKAKKKFGDVGNQFNKGARKKPREVEKEMEDVETLDTVMKVKKHAKPTKEKIGSVKEHREELQKLEEMDPEFFDFLKQNDASLLDFGDGEEDEDVDVDEEDAADSDDIGSSGGDSDDDNESNVREEKQLISVTAALLKSTIASAQTGSLSALKRLLAMFRAACIPNGSDEVTSENLDAGDEEKVVFSRYLIPSADIYQQTMDMVLAEAPKAFYALLGMSEDRLDRGALENLSKHPRWKGAQLLVLSFFKSYMTVLGGVARGSSASSRQIDEENSPAQVAVYLMQSLSPFVPLLVPLPRLSKALLKILLYVWSEGPDPTQDPQQLRAQAYLRIRQMAIQLPGAYAEECFRCAYLTYTRVCKTFTEFNGSSVLFMGRCIVELFQTDVLQAYQQGFLYIRQLALHLRTAVLKKTSDSVRQVSSWQFLNCLRLWTRVICSMPAEDELGALAFPLSQIIYGVMAIAQSVYLLPLRFHLISCLQLLAAHCQCFIPTAQRLLEVLELPELVTAKSTPSTELPPRLQFSIKFPAESITRSHVRDVIVLEAITLLRHDAEVYRYHVGFPEYAYLSTRKLRAFAKVAKVAKWRDMARTTASQMDGWASDAKRGRGKLGKSPVEVTDFEPLLPGGAAHASERLAKMQVGRGFSATTDITLGASSISKNSSSAKSRPKNVASDDDDDDDDLEEDDEEEEEEEEEGESDSEEEDEEENEEEADDDDDDDDEEEEEVVVQVKKVNAKQSHENRSKASVAVRGKNDKVKKMNVDSFFD